MKRAALVLAILAATPVAAKGRVPVTVVAAGGSPIARDVATALERKGAYVDLAPSSPASPGSMPIEQTKACIAEGRALAFRLEYGAAIAALESCLERVGPGLSRPEGSAALSSLLIELGAAAVGAGERERARSAFSRLARLAEHTAPDPSVHAPPVMQAWDDARKNGDPPRSISIEATPPWTIVWIDGRAVSAGERVPLVQGPHFASADAAGFQPWSGTLLIDGDTTRLPIRLLSLEPEARAASVRARAGTIAPNAPGAAEELTAAFGMAVVVVAGGRGAATSAVLLLPAEAGKNGASVGGRWTPSGGENPGDVIATGVSKKIGGGRPSGGGGGSGWRPKNRTLYIAGGVLAGILVVGAGATLLQPGESSAGDKEGTVVWEPPPPPLPPHGEPDGL